MLDHNDFQRGNYFLLHVLKLLNIDLQELRLPSLAVSSDLPNEGVER